MAVTRLCIFDFDGTLFKSPERPGWWHHKGWWSDPRSLRPPCVPSEPGEDWWVAGTVKAIQEANAAEDAYVVLLTGRKEGRFDSRVRALFGQMKLEFDEIRLSNKDDTQLFKVEQIKRLLREHPEVEVVEMWEDRPVRPYRATVEDAGLEFRSHKVDVGAKPVQCEETDEGKLIERVARRYQESLLG